MTQFTLLAMLFTALATPKAVPSSYFQVTAYGALGNGVHDDRPAIQAAMDAAMAAGGGTVYFPSGNYLLASATAAGAQLVETSWGDAYTLNFVGSGATLSTSTVNISMLELVGKWRNSEITGLTFLNTHGLTTQASSALYLQGGGGNQLRNNKVSGNTFKNFEAMIIVTGTDTLSIDNNAFVMDQGRDSGSSTNTMPNIAIWLHDNGANGDSVRVRIANNSYKGCGSLTDITSTVSHSCGDGLVNGVGYAGLIEGNTVQGFSAEGIAVGQMLSPNPGTTITGNLIDGTMIPGDQFGGGGWGIRVDANYTTVTNNIVINSVNGIFACAQTGCGGTGVNAVGLRISDNTVMTLNSGTQAVYSGINLVGLSRSIVTGNHVTFNSGTLRSPGQTFGIGITGSTSTNLSDSMTVTGNTVTNNIVASGPTPAALGMQWASNWNYSFNELTGFYYGFNFTNQTITQAQINSLLSGSTLNAINTTYITH